MSYSFPYFPSGFSFPRDTCQWKLGGPETFRASSSKLLFQKGGFEGYGGNRQNVAKGIRRFRIADPGKVLIQRDQSGAEAKIVAYLCRKGFYRALFDNGIKPHVFVGMHVFADVWTEKLKLDLKPYLSSAISKLASLPRWKELSDMIKSSDDWPPNQRYYFIAKKLVHASSYGMAAPRFALSVLQESDGLTRLTDKEAAKLLEYFFALFPEIRLWHSETEQIYRVKGHLVNLFGHPWYIDEPYTDELKRRLYAFVPQSTVGVITHICITKTQDYIEENHKDWDILLNGHDAMLWQVPDDREEIIESLQVTEKFMNQDLVSPRGEKFTMKSEAQVGRNWGPYKPGKNEDGLKEYKI